MSPSIRRPTARLSVGTAAALLATLGALAGCGSGEARPTERAGTPELRAELFDTILARTERRDAFSPVKNATLGYDPLAEMRALRDTVVDASTEERLFYALTRLSHSRRDRHLSLALVPGGLRLRDSTGVPQWGDGASPPARQAPIRILPDYGEQGGYYVGDVASDRSLAPNARPGDRILSIDARPVAELEAAMRPYIRHSSSIGLRWKTAEAMTQRTAEFPRGLRRETLRLEVRRLDGTETAYELPYLAADDIVWQRVSEPFYPGFRVVRSTPTWDLWLPQGERVGGVDGGDADSPPGTGEPDPEAPMVLVWYGFRETMLADVDSLVAFGQRAELLDRPLVIDVTRSRGGTLGAYAVQRLQPRPFKTTFGNVRLSDVIPAFVAQKRMDFEARNINDGGVQETMDDGTWLMEWLEEDVLPALERGEAYSSEVPFKGAHAPKDSDGVLQPAPVHFRGPVAIISGPSGGSHLDQFNAIFADNDLGPLIGMTAGGFSNTWEWEEVLTFPGTDQPVVGYMYDIGHTIRPNGEILEGNPAEVDEWVPLTAAGHADYYPRLLRAALTRMGVEWEM
jgi:hypothetical protein